MKCIYCNINDLWSLLIFWKQMYQYVVFGEDYGLDIVFVFCQYGYFVYFIWIVQCLELYCEILGFSGLCENVIMLYSYIMYILGIFEIFLYVLIII